MQQAQGQSPDWSADRIEKSLHDQCAQLYPGLLQQLNAEKAEQKKKADEEAKAKKEEDRKHREEAAAKKAIEDKKKAEEKVRRSARSAQRSQAHFACHPTRLDDF